MPGLRRYTVPVLNEELDQLLQNRYPTILVEGEVAQLQQPISGHCYVLLRDRGGSKNMDCSLSAVVWKDDWNRLRYRPAIGDRVLCRGRLAVYSPRGNVQLYVTDIAPAGQGDLAREIEARKARLMADGLLDPRRKRALPRYPRVVGVATSLTGAALQDFLKVSKGRFPAARILVAPCLVQGSETAPSVIRAVELLIEDGRSEVIVVTRGGGSKEDLLPFHDEGLARFLAVCPVPVVSAVGHQIDTTIADLVADAVAPTPSAAAMLVFPDGREMAQRVDDTLSVLLRAMNKGIEQRKERVEARKNRLRHPGERLREGYRRQVELERRLVLCMHRLIPDVKRQVSRVSVGLQPALLRLLSERRRKLESLEDRLRALSPVAVLDRGYAIVSGKPGLIRDPQQVEPGMSLQVRVRGGQFEVKVGGEPQLRLL